MGLTPTYHQPKGEKCETSVEHGFPLWQYPDGGYCSRPPHPSPTWRSCFVGARELGPWVRETKPLGKTHLGGNPSPDMTYLTYLEGLVNQPRKGSAENRSLQPAGGWMPQATWEDMLADVLHPQGIHPCNLPAPQDHPYVLRRLRTPSRRSEEKEGACGTSPKAQP